jgi:uncharacterized membrane protein YjdF
MKRPAGLYLAYVFQILIVVNILIAFSRGEYAQGLGGLLALGVTMVPAIISRRWKITLPWEISLFIALMFCLHVAGGIRGFYDSYYPYYDKVAHFIFGITISMLVFIGVLLLDQCRGMNLSRWMIVGFTVIFAMAMAGFWEIYEWTVDTFFGTHLQNGLDDTMLDMIFCLIGSIIVAFTGDRYLARYSKEDLTRSMISGEPPG